MSSIDEFPVWRDGKLLVLLRSSPVAPDRCIVTNELVFERSKISRQLSWGSEGPAKWMPTKIKMLWALAEMKFVTVTFGLSAKARATRYVTLVLSAACLVVGMFLFVEGLKEGGVPPPMGYLGGGAALIAVALALFANAYSVVDIVAMDEEFIWLRGAKRAFLESLPALSSRKVPVQPQCQVAGTGRDSYGPPALRFSSDSERLTLHSLVRGTSLTFGKEDAFAT